MNISIRYNEVKGSTNIDCPNCGYKNALSVSIKNGQELYYCHAGCPQKSVWRVLKGERPSAYLPPPKPCQRAILESTGAFLQRLLGDSLPAKGTLTETYLHRRGLMLPIPDTIRHLPSCRHTPSGKNFPAMLAMVGKEALHRTYLLPDGSGKADLTPAKMTLGSIGGYGVWLAPLAKKMAVTEGIENGLAVQQTTGISTVAALSAGNMTCLVLPRLPLASEIIIAADNDANGCGQHAAHVAAKRWIAEGRRVSIAMPPTPDTDFNDLLQESSQ